MATPAPLHLDAVVAMRSESRAAPRAMATVIFSFCFFEIKKPVFARRTDDRHCLGALRKVSLYISTGTLHVVRTTHSTTHGFIRALRYMIEL